MSPTMAILEINIIMIIIIVILILITTIIVIIEAYYQSYEAPKRSKFLI